MPPINAPTIFGARHGASLHQIKRLSCRAPTFTHPLSGDLVGQGTTINLPNQKTFLPCPYLHTSPDRRSCGARHGASLDQIKKLRCRAPTFTHLLIGDLVGHGMEHLWIRLKNFAAVPLLPPISYQMDSATGNLPRYLNRYWINRN